MHSLKADLDLLLAGTDRSLRIAADPVHFPRSYSKPADQELAALIAAFLAYGRVDLFRPVLREVFALLDRRGGPEDAIRSFQPELHGDAYRHLVYRWNRGVDFVLLFTVLREHLRDQPSLSPLFAGPTVRQGLSRAVDRLRATSVKHAKECGLSAASFRELPRGFQYFLPSPDDGSACKRWNLFLRWMVRPTDGIDLGLWKEFSPAQLVIPLDTHIGRIGRFLGLTTRNTDSWDTAEDITASLRKLDPSDPLRYDFAIAHLGISGACNGKFQAAVCPKCPLERWCVVRNRQVG